MEGECRNHMIERQTVSIKNDREKLAGIVSRLVYVPRFEGMSVTKRPVTGDYERFDLVLLTYDDEPWRSASHWGLHG
jgi:hypothetical protein